MDWAALSVVRPDLGLHCHFHLITSQFSKSIVFQWFINVHLTSPTLLQSYRKYMADLTMIDARNAHGLRLRMMLVCAGEQCIDVG